AMGLPCGEIILTTAVVAILLTAPIGAVGIDTLAHRLTNMQAGENRLDEF
ncbi:MAG: sodium:proton antiporter, partial [Eubacteriales bacterium]